MNSNSIVVLRSDYPSGHPLQLQSLTGSTTSEQLFQMNSANNTTAVVSIPSQAGIVGAVTPFDPNANPAVTQNYPGGLVGRSGSRPYFTSTSFLGRGFRVRAMGYINNLAATTNAQTTTVKITLGNAVSSTKVLASVASATNFASGSFNIDANLNWDSTSGIVCGSEGGYIGTTVVTSATLTNAGVAAAAYTNLVFCCSVVFATSSASSTATLVEFSIEQI